MLSVIQATSGMDINLSNVIISARVLCHMWCYIAICTAHVEGRQAGPRALLHALHHYSLQAKTILADLNLAVTTPTAKLPNLIPRHFRLYSIKCMCVTLSIPSVLASYQPDCLGEGKMGACMQGEVYGLNSQHVQRERVVNFLC